MTPLLIHDKQENVTYTEGQLGVLYKTFDEEMGEDDNISLCSATGLNGTKWYICNDDYDASYPLDPSRFSVFPAGMIRPKEMNRQEFKDFAQKIVADVRFRSNEEAMYKVMEHLRAYTPAGMIAVETVREMNGEILEAVTVDESGNDLHLYAINRKSNERIIDLIASKYIGEKA